MATELQAPAPAAAEEPNLRELLLHGVDRHRAGDLPEAERAYRAVLEAIPEQVDALHFLGVLAHQCDQSDAALALIRRSIEIDPTLADRHNNLGNVLVDREEWEAATAAYRRCLAIDPRNADAWSNLGVALRAQRQLDEAADAYRKAIEINPDHPDAHHNYGNLLTGQGRVKESVYYYCRGVTLRPRRPESRRMLGIAYSFLGQFERAAEVFREWLADDPGNPIAVHLLSACTGDDVPARASDGFVEATFETFASSFDAKLERLSYRAPALVAQALARASPTPDRTLVALDAGCGTGLSGPLIAPWVQRLTGVDLSAPMLKQAAARGYDELVKGELTEFIAAHPGRFDLIVSADTLCYFGDLEPVLRAATCALRARGLVIFTVEELASDEHAPSFRLNISGRYSHSRAYVSRTLAANGFDELAMESDVLRNEAGNPVAGLVVTARAGTAVAA